MDLIYTDTDRVEQGVLQNFNIDFDTTDKKDFQITVGIQNNVLQGGSWWYIEGTEYGGRVDEFEVLSESNKIRYTGRNFRGVLKTKIIQPPVGEDYRIASGNLQEVVDGLLKDAALQGLFVADASDIEVNKYKFNRYVNVYDGISSLAVRYGLIPSFEVKDGVVHISFTEPTDYSDENEYTQDDLNFSIKKTFANVNHLICLGQGELKDRMVIHLFADANGNISDTQTLFDIDEVVDVYENVNAEDEATLRTEGIERLNELKNKDSFEVTIPDASFKIGDIIGGIESVTNTYVAREIVNVIAKITDTTIDLEYKVGEDESASKSSSSDSSGGGGSSSGGGTVDWLDLVYPIDSIYMSANNVNPSTLFGGTWEAWGSGRVPVGVDASNDNFNEAEKTGGANSESFTPNGTVGDTTLTVNQIPSHNHTINHGHTDTFAIANGGAHTHNVNTSAQFSAGTNRTGAWTSGNTVGTIIPSSGSHSHTLNGSVTDHSGSSGNKGGNGSHNHTFTGKETTISHLQPYITCYMWKRTA